MSGLTPTGFIAKTTEQIRADVVAEILANVDPLADLSEREPMGQMVAIEASADAELWEVQASTYDGFDPDSAEGDQLDKVCALNGITRLPEKKSYVLQTCTLTAGTYGIGALQVKATGSDTVWKNVASVTSPGGAVTGIRFEPVDAGPIAANAATLTVIAVPVSGFSATTNPLDAELGRYVETDPELRIRRLEELADQGASSLPAIRAKILKVAGVVACRVRENTTMATVNGLPAKSFEVIIWDGVGLDADNDAIAAAIWGDKPSGMQAFGATTVNVTDDDGDAHAIGFTRATQKDIYLAYTLVVDAALYPVDGDDQVKAAAVAAGELYSRKPGDDVTALRLKYAPFAVLGVLDVNIFYLDFTASPVVSANLAIAIDEMAVFDTSRVTVTT